MNAFLAIIGDTWRQSKQQIVFFILAGVLLLTSVCFIGIFRVKTVETGERFISLPVHRGSRRQGARARLGPPVPASLVHKELGHDEAAEGRV